MGQFNTSPMSNSKRQNVPTVSREKDEAEDQPENIAPEEVLEEEAKPDEEPIEEEIEEEAEPVLPAQQKKKNEARADANAARQIWSDRVKEQNDIRAEIVDEELEGNNYPTDIRPPMKRSSLTFLAGSSDGRVRNAEFDEGNQEECVFCGSSRSTTTRGELLDCEGFVNGIGRKVPCGSKFHLSCAAKYNDGAFLFKYAARPECQNGLLCPLHCCVACNGDLMRQSAYEGPLTECTECLRAFHTETCLPMGAELVTVRMEIGGRIETIEMMDCPSHAAMDRPKEQMKGCCGCNKDTGKGLVNCGTCLRSFHKGCRTVEKVSGRVAEEKACDHCLLQKTLRSDVPVISFTHRKPALGFTRAWTVCPKELQSNEEFGKIGMAAVELLPEKKFVIVPVNSLTKLTEQLLHLAPTAVRAQWEKVQKDFKEFARLPVIYKQVAHTVKRSKNLLKNETPEKREIVGLCECTGRERCTTSACKYWEDHCECPPACNDVKKGRVCHNRKATEGKVNPRMERRKTEKKGYGVFATGAIRKGEFLAEIVGERIDREEKEKRMRSVGVSQDAQPPRYMQDVWKGITIDCARYGNIARYINHCCFPNAKTTVKMIFKRAREEKSLFEPRVTVHADRDIEKGEEISLDYQMTDDIDCECGHPKCSGNMSKVAANDDSKDGQRSSRKRSSGGPPAKRARK